MCDCLTSFNWVFDSHFCPIVWIAAYDGLDCPCMVFWLSDNKREICFLYFVVMDEFLKLSQSHVIFRYQEKTTCLFIQTMHDSRPVFACLSVKIFHLCHKLIDHTSKSSCIGRGRVSIDPCIFAHNEKIIIFKNYL